VVEPSLVDLKSLSDEVRFRIFDYLWSRGVRSSELGIEAQDLHNNNRFINLYSVSLRASAKLCSP